MGTDEHLVRSGRAKISKSNSYSTNQGVVGSNPAGRAKFQGLGAENQVLLPAVGPLWDPLSTGSSELVVFQRLGRENQVLLSLLWDRVGLLIHTSALAIGDAEQRPRAAPINNQVCLRQ